MSAKLTSLVRRSRGTTTKRRQAAILLLGVAATAGLVAGLRRQAAKKD